MTTPDYYKRCGHECRELSANYPHPIASAIEYVWRHKGKNGIKDLYKAKDWLEYYFQHIDEYGYEDTDPYTDAYVHKKQEVIASALFNECFDKKEYPESRFWLAIKNGWFEDALNYGLVQMIEQEEMEKES